eukprot:NODE_3136_length_593_cov_870.292279_g2624_i0.p1 GENE.NODE_3136_length_593_cov_870.292279_g2624_i0~~NODE_3136_length_593_cov_870.292279_g2624_i0.p1  ORF type:complete len:126 (+),score=44.30 NODE_3136_length_593_cov_870.292279_g2624_i0:87-464(+)
MPVEKFFQYALKHPADEGPGWTLPIDKLTPPPGNVNTNEEFMFNAAGTPSGWPMLFGLEHHKPGALRPTLALPGTYPKKEMFTNHLDTKPKKAMAMGMGMAMAKPAPMAMAAMAKPMGMAAMKKK